MTSMRTFDTGATRDGDKNKYDYEGFLSPAVLEEYARYMHKHRIQPDGNLRDSDNWQKGIPLNVYIKSMWRHFFDVWSIHRGRARVDDRGDAITMNDALCALLFNVMGYLHEYLPENATKWFPPTIPEIAMKRCEYRPDMDAVDRMCDELCEKRATRPLEGARSPGGIQGAPRTATANPRAS